MIVSGHGLYVVTFTEVFNSSEVTFPKAFKFFLSSVELLTLIKYSKSLTLFALKRVLPSGHQIM